MRIRFSFFSLIVLSLYILSLVGLFFITKRTVVNKDIRLWTEAKSSLQEVFDGYSRLVSVDYSGKNVKAIRINPPTLSNTIRPKSIFNMSSQKDEPIPEN